jgi:adenylate cyclase
VKLEIVRKFIVNDSKLTLLNSGDHIVQGCLSDNNENSIRVRRINDDAYLTIKNSDTAMVRSEFEYPIDLDEANYMLKFAD